MSQPQSIDEIMQRIRAQVRERQGGRVPPDAAASGDSDKQETSGILDRIRQRLKTPQQPVSAPYGDKSAQAGVAPDRPRLALHDLSRLHGEVGTCLATHGEVGQLNPRNPGLLNSAIQFVKKVMRRSLTWYTRPLHRFQGAVVRALQQITAILQNHDHALQALARELGSHADAIQQSATEEQFRELQVRSASAESKLKALEKNVDALDSAFDAKLDQALSVYAQRVASLADELEAFRSELRLVCDGQREAALQRRGRDRDVRRLVSAIETGKLPLSSSQAQPVPPMFPSEIKRESEFDYFLFEERYRGDETDIRDRQKEYVEYFRGRENVVDIGCGRGEFLELLRSHSINARGVELGTDQYLLCREKGLDVVQQDLFAFLESVPDGSLGGLFSAQVIEHLSASDQLRYVALAHRKTQPGSPVIFETINPECAYALLHNFFLDPTHVRPVHPETLKFAMESANFKDVKLRFSGPVSERRIPALQLLGNPPGLQQFNRAIEQLNDLIYGYQDYAVIGWK
jgi:SAM-dependent methyltransferase